MSVKKLRGPAIGLALALLSGVLVLGQDPVVRVPAAPGPRPLQSLALPVAPATTDRPGLDVLRWRRDFSTLSSREFRGARPGTDVVLQGQADALEALFALDPDTNPSSIVLSLAADGGLTLGADGAVSGAVAGVPVRVSASFYQSRDGVLFRVPGGFIVSGTQIVLWSERGAAREPLIASVLATFGTNPPARSAVAAFGTPQLTATLLIDADGNAVASPGDTLRYRLTIPNTGDAAMTNVSANLPLDPNTAAVAGSLNVSPIALDQAVTTNEDTPLPITLTGSDADGNALTYTVVTQPAHGVVVQASPGSAGVTYTPAADYTGPDSFTVRNNDGRVDSNEVATISLTVGPVNDAPSFTKGADQTVFENSPAQTVPAWATAISPGPADETAQTITFEITNNTAPQLFSVAPAVSPDGTLTFTPATDFSGTATISIRAHDSGGTANGGVDVSPVSTFTITLTDINNAPSFTKGADQTVLEDSGAQTVPNWATGISAGVNETQTVTFEITGNDNAALFAAGPAVNGTTGTLTYTAAANANGAATITLRARDDGGTANGGVDASPTQTFTINVTAVNDAPSFTKGADAPALEDSGAQTVAGWATAISRGPSDESGQTLTFVVTNNTNAALFSAGPAVNAANGNLTFTPALDAFGTATITLRLDDDGGTLNGGANQSGTQTFDITITNVNDAPSFTKGANQTVLEDTGPQTVAGWATALSPGPNEAGQVLTFEVTANDQPAMFSAGPAVNGTTGNLTYTPAPNAVGTATIQLRIKDDGGTANGGVDASPTQPFTITLTPVNDAPSFTKGADVTRLEDSGAQTVAGWATAIVKGGADESGQILTFAVTGNTNAGLFTVAPAVNGTTGDLTFTTAPNAHGTATITLQLSDDGGTANGGADTSPAQTFTITLTNVNDPPSFTKGANQTVLEDSGLQTVAGWATAMSQGPNESGQVLTFEVTGNDNPALFSIGPAVNATTGTLTYTTAPNAVGFATIQVRIKDDGGTANGGVDASPSQSFTITLTPVNDAPSFTKGPDVTRLEDSGAQTVAGWATAIAAGGADESGQTLTFVVTNNTNAALFAAGPLVNGTNGNLTFTPALDAHGTATITLRLDDNGGVANGGVDQSPTQTFTITLTNVNDAPSFTKGANQTVLEDPGAQTVAGWATALSPGPNEAGQILSFEITSNNNPGLFSAGPVVNGTTGTLTYTPAPNAVGTATIQLRIKDDGGTLNGGVDASPTQQFTITVDPVNDAPSFTVGANQTFLEDSGLHTVPGWATAISKGGPDESGQTLTFVVTNNTNPGLFSGAPSVDATNGNLTFTPAADAFGTATITLRLDDNGGTANGGANQSGTQTFDITITNVNDAPSFTKGANQTVLEDAGPQTVAGWATALSPGPNESGQLLSFEITAVDQPTLFAAGPSVSGTTGDLTYTSAPNAVGTATITVRITDDGGTANSGVNVSATQQFTITVDPVNDAPSFTVGANQTFLEDSGLHTVPGWATAISAGGADEAGQTLTFVVTNNTNPGLFSGAPSVNATNGNLTFTPAADAFGTATITLRLDDDGGTANGGANQSGTQTFDITITNVNDVPSFTKGADQTVPEDAGPQTVNPWATAISAGPNEGGQALTFEITNNTNAALFSAGPLVSAGGVLTYTPALNANGAATITLRITDDGGTANSGVDASATQTFLITVTAVNDAPSAVDDAYGVSEGGTLAPAAPGVLGNDTDVEGSGLTASIVTGPLHASLFTLNPNGSFNYTHDGSETLTDTFTYRANDGGVDSNLATVTITITPVNDAPVANADAYGVNEGATLAPAAPGVLGNDTDAEGSGLTASIVTGPLHASSFTLNANGSFTYTHDGSETPLSDSFTYQASDGVALSNIATVTITITPVNDPPVVDLDEDNSGGTAGVNYAITFTEGDSAKFLQDVTDAVITDNDHTTLTSLKVTLTNRLDPGFEVLDVDLTGFPAFTKDYDITTDPAQGVLTITAASPQPIADFVTLLRRVTYSNTDAGPDPTNRIVTFVANDGTSAGPAATTTITVISNNQAPVAAGNTFGVNEGGTLNVGAPGVLAGDTDPDGDTLTAVLVAGPTHASSFTLNPNGSFDYVHDGNGFDADSFTYKANDGTVDSNTVTVTINVTSVNDAPTFVKGADVTVLEDSGGHTTVAWATAINPGGAEEAGQVLTFTVTGNTNAGLFLVQPAVDATTGTLTFTPAANAFGAATITLTLSDNGGTANGGVDSSAQTFVVTVTGVNDAPSFTKGADQTVLEDAAPQSVSGWATAISAGPNEGAQTVAFEITNNTNTALFAVAPAVSATGTLSYTLAANANGTAAITLRITDNGGTLNGGVDVSATQTFNINVTAVNDAPSFTLAGPDASLPEDICCGTATFPNWAQNRSAGPPDEAGQTLTFVVTGNTNPSLFTVQPSFDASNGSLSFTLAANAFGVTTITVRLDDDGGTANGGQNQSPTQSFTITVRPVNDAPSFTTGADQTVNEDAGAQTVNPWATAISAGPNESGQVVAFEITNNTNPSLFSAGPLVSAAGVLTYTPAADAFGSATITLRIIDDGGTTDGGTNVSATQTFVITVNSVNDAPSFTAGTAPTVLEDSGAQTVSGFATAMSVGPANETGQVLSFNVTPNTVPASLTFSAGPTVALDGTLTYTPAANAHGTGTFNVILSDDGGTANGGVNSVTHILTITVTPVNDPPTFTPGVNQTSNEDAGLQTVANFVPSGSITSGPNETGQTVTFTITGNTNSGLFTGTPPAIGATGTLTYTAAPNASGVATLTYHASDNGGTANGGADTTTPDQSFTITITAVNDAPVVTNKNFTAQTNMPISIAAGSGLLTGVTDADNGVNGCGPLTFTVTNVSATTPAGGVVTPNLSTGSFDFTPPPGVTGDVTFTYQVQDNGCPGSATSLAATVTFTVSGPVIWFVDNSVGVTGSGVLGSPFKTLAEAAAVDAASHRVFLYNGTYATGLTLNTSEWLVSQGAVAAGASAFDTFMGITPPAGTLARPAMTGPAASATVQSTVTMGTSAVLNGIAISSGAATGFVANVTGFTVANTSVSAGALAISSSAGSPSGTATFISTTSTGGANGISLTNVAGNWAFGTGALTNNTSAAFLLTNSAANAPVITYGGTINPTAAGRVVDIGTASASTGLRGGSVTFSGTIGNTNANHAGIRLQNSTAGILAFTNTINGTSSTAGVTLATNPSTTVNFTGGLTLSTSTGAAFSATGGGTVNISGTNNITTTSGAGLNFNAVTSGTGVTFNNVTSTTGGAVAFTSTGASDFTFNDVTSTTGTAVSITTATGDFIFHAIASNGASKGISVTSATGTFTVNGSGTTDGSGGTIQNATSRGAEFISSNNITLKNMTFTNNGVGGSDANCGDALGATTTASFVTSAACESQIHLQTVTTALLNNIIATGGDSHGLNGIAVNGLTLTDVDFETNGDQVGEDGVQLVNSSGTITVNGTSIFRDNAANQFEAQNGSGTATFNISNGFFGLTNFPTTGAAEAPSPGATTLNSGLLISGSGTANMTVTATGSTFEENYANGYLSDTAGSATMNITVGAAGAGNANAFNNNGVPIEIVNAGTGAITYVLRQNTITNDTTITGIFATTAIVATRSGAGAVMTGTIDDNVIGSSAAGATSSGCFVSACDGISLVDNATSSTNAYHVTVTNNEIYHVQGGITGVIGGGSGSPKTSFVITGNTVGNPDAPAQGNAIQINSGTLPASTPQTCVEISSNTLNGAWGVGLNDDSIRYRHRGASGSSFRVRNFGGGDTTALTTFVTGANTFGVGTVDPFGFQLVGANTFTGGAGACPQ